MMSLAPSALTIDLEDWYHPELVRSAVDPAERRGQIERSTAALLELLRARGVKATFFVVGELGLRHPQLIETIVAHGHELACHGFSHKPLWELTPDGFRGELRAFASMVDQVVPGTEVIGFRAPTFSLDNRTRWALTILADHGFRYDSSIFPSRTPLYGISKGPVAPYRPSSSDVAVVDERGPLAEFPMTVWEWGPLRIPICGGFYLRALPFSFVRACLRQIEKTHPFAIYVHPWECYVDTPRMALSPVPRFITYHNLRKTKRRLVALMDEFGFAPMRTVLEATGVGISEQATRPMAL